MAASTVPFAIVDVFSNTAFKGNPLAVVDNTSATLSTEQMKLIARQFNLSETAFFFRPKDSPADFALRSFLPDGREVFGAGHNILGVWWHLANSGILDLERAPDELDQQTGKEMRRFGQLLGGQVSNVQLTRVQMAGEQPSSRYAVSLRQSPPGFGNKHPDPVALANAFNLSPRVLGLAEAPHLQPQIVSTSTTRHLHVPIQSIDALNSVIIQRDKLLEQHVWVDEKSFGLFLFTSVPGEHNRYQARFFSPGMNGEDPATGSAAGPLSALLYQNGLLDVRDGVGKITVLQGFQVGRECELAVTLNVLKQTHGEEHLDVDIEGSGVQVAEGVMAIPS